MLFDAPAIVAYGAAGRRLLRCAHCFFRARSVCVRSSSKLPCTHKFTHPLGSYDPTGTNALEFTIIIHTRRTSRYSRTCRSDRVHSRVLRNRQVMLLYDTTNAITARSLFTALHDIHQKRKLLACDLHQGHAFIACSMRLDISQCPPPCTDEMGTQTAC